MGEPREFVPLDEHGEPDHDRVPVELMQHLPGQTQALVDWTGGTQVLVNGGPAVLLPGKGGVVGLGDYALHRGGRFVVEHADGIARRYRPDDADGDTPVEQDA